jgi:glycosidase
MVYYGDETGMWGSDDPCDRHPMVWDDMEFDDQKSDPLERPRKAAKVAFDHELHKFYRDAIALRSNEPALRRGSWTPVASNDDAKFFAFRRESDGRRLLVAFNRGESPYQWNLPDGAGEGSKVVFATEQIASPRLEASGGKLVLDLPPYSGVVIAEQ